MDRGGGGLTPAEKGGDDNTDKNPQKQNEKERLIFHYLYYASVLFLVQALIDKL